MCERSKEGGREWGSSLHQMRLSAGTLLSQTGTHLPMVSCEVLREGRNKGAKRLCDNEGAQRRALERGDTGCTRQAVPITLQLLLLFFSAIQEPCVDIHGEVQGQVSLRFPCNTRADLKLFTRCFSV